MFQYEILPTLEKLQFSGNPSARAEFYIVRYGVAPDRLFNNYQIYDATSARIDSLNRGIIYCVTFDAVNDSGVTAGRSILRL